MLVLLIEVLYHTKGLFDSIWTMCTMTGIVVASGLAPTRAPHVHPAAPCHNISHGPLPRRYAHRAVCDLRQFMVLPQVR